MMMPHVLVLMLIAFVNGSTLWTLCPLSKSLPTVDCVQTMITRSVHEALFHAGAIPNPLLGSNDVTLRWIAETDWVYSTRLSVEKTKLNFSFLGGYGSEIFCDNQKIAGPIESGSFVPVSITLPSQCPLSSFRDIKIVLKSLVTAAASIGKTSHFFQVPKDPPEPQHGFSGVEYLRVPQYSFGWDWGPAFASVGFELVPDGEEQLGKIFVESEKRGDFWNLGIRIKEMTTLPSDSVSVHVSNKTFSWSPREKLHAKMVNQIIVIDSFVLEFQVREWFPRNPSLYTVQLCFSDSVCFERSQVGFRQVELKTGGKLFFNNEETPVEIRGTNLIPSNAFSAPPTDEEIESIFSEIVFSGMNLVRVWGGGFYGSDRLYSLANEHGIMVWDEAKFACATYPFEDAEYREKVVDELKYQFERISGNPSLVVISGDNEVNQMLEQNWYGVAEPQLGKLKTVYATQMIPTIAEIVKQVWPPGSHQIVFIPTSPTQGIDTHFYDYSGDCRDVAKYSTVSPGIVSEYGFQSFCDWGNCLSKMVVDASVEDVGKANAIDSEFLGHRQHRQTGTNEIIHQVSLLLSDIASPSVEEFVWYSQISQAVCLKAATESFRRNPAVAGVMYWQLNDVWPGASWSTIDFYGSRKPAWYTVETSLAERMSSIFVSSENELVVALVGSPATDSPSATTLLVVDILLGDFRTFSLSIGGRELFRQPVADICPSKSCVAALSSSNYVLIGSPNRHKHMYSEFDIKHPIQVESLSIEGENILRLTGSIPTPFIFIGGAVNLPHNFLFLAPIDGWRYVDIPQPSTLVGILTFWSFLNSSQASSIRSHVQTS